MSLTDDRAIADLVAFARIEVASGDLEPWAELLRMASVSGLLGNDEELLWAIKLYNAYDDLGSAWNVLARWSDPVEWGHAPDRAECAAYPCTQERRNLRGGLVVKHLQAYVDHLDGARQRSWLEAVLAHGDARVEFLRLYQWVRRVWGVGRQTAFEWVEFLAKAAGFDATAPSAELWESEGPRRSLQRIYGDPNPSPEWLDARADELRSHLAAEGVDLSWEDFETVICDFNVMRDGRYYPGKHLASLREEITRADDARLDALFAATVPEPWNTIAPGIDKAKLLHYRQTGELLVAP